MEVNRFVVLLIGISINIKCSDGKCWCSESTKIASCIDSGLSRVPSFSNYVRRWVKVLNLRFNSLIDLSRLLSSEYPKLTYVDVRDNPNYLCNDVHRLLVGKGLIIESHCPDETTVSMPRITRMLTSTTESPSPPKTDERRETTAAIDYEMTTESEEEDGTIQGRLNVTGKLQCECECYVSLTVSITAMVTTVILSVAGFAFKILWKKYCKSRNIDSRFGKPAPKSYKPRVRLFDDISRSKPSVSKPIYTGPLRPCDIFSVETSTDEEANNEEAGYEVPIPTRRAPPLPPARVSSASSAKSSLNSARPSTSQNPPRPSTSTSTSQVVIEKPQSSTSAKSEPSTSAPKVTPPPPPKTSPPKRQNSGSGSQKRGKGRGRGRGRGIYTVSAIVHQGPPASNTRSSQNKLKTFTTHM